MIEPHPTALRLASELHAGSFVSNVTQNEYALRIASAEMLARQYHRIAELEARLEIDPRHSYDGIDCRDATIAELEAQLKAIDAAEGAQ